MVFSVSSERHMQCLVTEISKVFKLRQWDSNPRPLDRQSHRLTTEPTPHQDADRHEWPLNWLSNWWSSQHVTCKHLRDDSWVGTSYSLKLKRYSYQLGTVPEKPSYYCSNGQWTRSNIVVQLPAMHRLSIREFCVNLGGEAGHTRDELTTP